MESKMPSIQVKISPYTNNKFIGLNWYRNANPFEQASVKRLFTNKFVDLLSPYAGQTLDKYNIKYVYYYKNKATDLSNACSIMDKFFQDSLITAGIITNDNVEKGMKIEYEVGGLDKENPRIEITLGGYSEYNKT